MVMLLYLSISRNTDKLIHTGISSYIQDILLIHIGHLSLVVVNSVVLWPIYLSITKLIYQTFCNMRMGRNK